MSRSLLSTIHVATIAAFALAASGASASSIWDRVIDPSYAERDYAHRFAAEKEHAAEALDLEADIAYAQGGPDDENFKRKRANAVLEREAARSILERFGAATSSDARLRFDYGHILARLDQPDLLGLARKTLLGALKLAPDDPRAGAAWFDIAICDAKLHDRQDEANAYTSALAIEDDPGQRALLFGNLAESRMSLGDLESARDAAETSLQLHDLDLVRYTLGVILDRSGDEWGAIQQVTIAVGGKGLGIAILSQPGVFFEPEYEKHYYEALGWLSAARALAPKSPEWQFDLLGALKEFHAYVDQSAADDRWRKRAQDHIDQVEATLGLKSPKPTK
jgi:tetratricopeptide (TPR) repeat protein